MSKIVASADEGHPVLCGICDTYSNGPSTREQHLASKRHRTNVTSWRTMRHTLCGNLYADDMFHVPGIELCKAWDNGLHGIRCTFCNTKIRGVLELMEHVNKSPCGHQFSEAVIDAHELRIGLLSSISTLSMFSTTERCYYVSCKNQALFNLSCSCTDSKGKEFNVCADHLICPACGRSAESASVDVDAICTQGLCRPRKICEACRMEIDNTSTDLGEETMAEDQNRTSSSYQ